MVLVMCDSATRLLPPLIGCCIAFSGRFVGLGCDYIQPSRIVVDIEML